VSGISRASAVPFGVTGDELRVKGEQLVTFTLNGETYRHEFSVCELATDADVIIGTDYLSKTSANLDLEAGILRLKSAGKLTHDPWGREQCGTAVRAALTVFSRPNARYNRQKSCWIGCNKQSKQSPKQTEIHSPDIELKSSDSWLVKSTKSIRIPPRVKQMVVGRVELPRRQ
jgi:hypothetical protein